MTEWEKLKVGELKEELKSRGIPLTGLKLKQQLIDKLVEIESGDAEDIGATDRDSRSQTAPQPDASIAKVDTTVTEASSPEQPAFLNESHSAKDASVRPTEEKEIPDKTIASQSIALQTNDAHDVTPNEPIELEEPDKDTIFVPEQDTEMKDDADVNDRASQHANSDKDEDQVQAGDETLQDGSTALPTSEAQVTTDESLDMGPTNKAELSSKVPTPEILEDQRKRKRRSISPAPDTQEVQKKAKTNDGGAVVTRRESEALEAIQAATDEVQEGRAANDPDEEPIRPMEASNDPKHTRVAKEVGGLPDASELQDSVTTKEVTIPRARDTESPVPHRYAAPSVHPATASIYIRNFKRPLHIPTLRNHISSLAKSSSDHGTDTVKVFYLDVIRTHAFISFATVSAASRVRNAMHETRFPDEPMREPLWVDFVPDEKVQEWIDQETGSANGSFGGGRSSGRKYEVIYEKYRDGVEAILRDSSDPQMRPSFQQQRSGRVSQDHTNTGRIASGIHPDRSGLVATTHGDHDRNHPARVTQTQGQPLPVPPKSDSGKGFKELDELFSSTATKPKLYYKSVSQSIVNSRLDMLHDLTARYSDTGRSGDEGMKRYTFEEYRGQEDWVDKGPEFGFGRKGQERLEGFRGRGRGMGGFRGRGRGGDSWRGTR